MNTTTLVLYGFSRAKQRFFGIARVAIFLVAVFLVLGAASAHAAYGDMREAALQTGRQLASMGQLDAPFHRVLLNGEPIYLSSAMVDESVKEVLDRFEAECISQPGSLPELYKALPKEAKKKLGSDDGAGLGILRTEVDDEGVVACLAQESQGGWSAMQERLARFAQSGDLGEVGDLRYLYVTRQGARTHVLSVWTQGSFRFSNLVAKEGEDAPGSDARDVPRPLNAKRVLTAAVEGAPYGVRIYNSAATSEELRTHYRQELSQYGWTEVSGVAEAVDGGLAFSRAGVDLLVLLQPKQGRTFVSTVEMRPR